VRFAKAVKARYSAVTDRCSATAKLVCELRHETSALRWSSVHNTGQLAQERPRPAVFAPSRLPFRRRCVHAIRAFTRLRAYDTEASRSSCDHSTRAPESTPALLCRWALEVASDSLNDNTKSITECLNVLALAKWRQTGSRVKTVEFHDDYGRRIAPVRVT